MDEKMMLSQEVFSTVCKAIEERGWRYERKDGELLAKFSIIGEDLPMECLIGLEPDFYTLKLICPMPYAFSEEKRMEGAIATCAASYALNDGLFEYDINSGRIYFKMVSSYKGLKISTSLIHYMIDYALTFTDNYNDKFLALAKDYIGIEDFIKRD